jgi:hypothetical protein
MIIVLMLVTVSATAQESHLRGIPPCFHMQQPGSTSMACEDLRTALATCFQPGNRIPLDNSGPVTKWTWQFDPSVATQCAALEAEALRRFKEPDQPK